MRHINRVLALVSLFTSSLTLASGGDGVGNGGGLSENNLLYAFLHLKPMIETCLYSKGCGLTYPENALLTKIHEAHEDELRGAGIRFDSSKLNPDRFDVDEHGVARTAVTGDAVGSPIYFNLERLYPLSDGQPQPIDLLTAAGFLVHELGHHHGIKDHTYLDRLGGKVRDFVSARRWLSIDLKRYGGNPFTVSTFIPSILGEFTSLSVRPERISVVVSNGLDVQDLSPLFESSTRCANKDEFTFLESSATDLTWMPLPAFDKQTEQQTVRFQIVVNWSCNPWPKPGEHKRFNQTIEVSNQFKIQTLRRVDLFNWTLDPFFTPERWRTQTGAIFTPVNAWQAKEVGCEKTDYNLNPLGPCDP